MILKCNLKWVLLMFIVSNISDIGASVKFGSKESAIKVHKNAALNIENGLVVDEGAIVKRDLYSGIFGTTITFSKSILQNGETSGELTGLYFPGGFTREDEIHLDGNHSYKAEPGTVLQEIEVSGLNNRIEGQPSFINNPGIELEDSASTVTLALQGKVNRNISLNGGVVTLDDNLNFDDNSQFLGNGTVKLNSKQISFGGKDSTWSNEIYWDSASDMVLYSRLNLTGTWTFNGENHITGNGNILDLSSGAKLWVKHGSTLNLRDIKLRGLGSGSIVFEDRTSQVRLSDSQLEMDSDYTVTEGGIYVDGESTIYTKEHFFRLDQNGSMTVDGTCLWYDLLSQEENAADTLTVRPGRSEDVARRYIAYLNDGIIRQATGVLSTPPLVWAGVNVFHKDLWLSPYYKAIVMDDKVIFGESNSMHFSRTSDSLYLPLIEIRPGKKLTLLNIVLESFSPEHLKFGTDATISFSDKTTIELCKDEELNMTWTFRGNCILRGNGHSLTLGANGNIVIEKSDVRYSALLFDDISIKGITGNNIRCIDNTGTMSFNNVNWMQDSDYSLTVGKMALLGKLKMSGDAEFSYETSQASKIAAFASLSFDTGFEFSYAPSVANRQLIEMEDESSKIFLNGATLSSTTTGLILTKGRLVLDHKNFIYNEDSPSTPATSLSQALCFGDGEDDLYIEIMPGGNLDVKSGILNYRNIN